MLDAFTGQDSSRLAFVDLEDAKRILNVIRESYARLSEKVYEGLLFQTRLKPYIDAIGLGFEDGQLALDFTKTAAMFNTAYAQDSQKALVDLGEFLYHYKAMGKDEIFAELSTLFMQYVQDSIHKGTLAEDLAVLGADIFTALGHSIGSAQDDKLIGNDLANLLSGEDGDDKLYGKGGNDRLIGGAGNDYLEGGAGNDTYVFSKGHGQDVIYDYQTTANSDTIQFTDLNRNAVIFRQEGYHLIMQNSETDSVKIYDFFYGDAYKIEHFQFADQSFSLEDLMTKGLLIHGTEANDTFQYWRGKAEVYAGAGNDTLHGADKDDVLYGEDGDDKLYGKGGNDRLYGGDGADYLYAGAGNDVLSGGKGADRLHGGIVRMCLCLTWLMMRSILLKISMFRKIRLL